MISRKRALVNRYCDVGDGCTFALRNSDARVFVANCDPISAVQACMEGLQVTAIESIVSPNSVSKSVVTGNEMHYGRDKCAPTLRHEDDGFDD